MGALDYDPFVRLGQIHDITAKPVMVSEWFYRVARDVPTFPPFLPERPDPAARAAAAGTYLERILAIDAPGVGVYLDPMYPPPRRSSALPKRALQVLRQLVGDSSDAAELLAAARSRAARVVVKRPHRAPPLAPGTSHALASKLVRFDVYVNASRVRRAGDAAGTSREDV